MITPLLTQLTYEGLVDELIGIKNCEYPSHPPSEIIINKISSLCRAAAIRTCTPDRSGRATNCQLVDFPYRPRPCSRTD